MGDAIEGLAALAKKLAGDTRRQAEVLNAQALDALALSKLQPWPENDLTRLSAIKKREKARRLLNIAAQMEKVNKNGTGLGSPPKPVVIYR